VEVDIEVPKEYHELLSPYPLFPKDIDGKLMCTLYDKKKYRTHIAYLIVGQQLGYKVTKIHRAIRFRQEPIMHDYVMMLAQERKEKTP
jgi:hypothetical protein